MSFTLWFMGRPAAGKSTIAKRIENDLRERGYPMENLDGDEVRKNLHPDLGFSREDRKINNRRTAHVCRLLNRNGITVVTGMITPFRDAQREAREIVEENGTFVLIYVKCSVEECARRDPKGLYQQARDGKVDNFTGVNHPFEEPHNPDIILDTEELTPDESTERVIDHLDRIGLLDRKPEAEYRFEITRNEEAEIKERLDEQGYIDRN